MKEHVSKFNEKAKKQGANRTHPGFPWISNGNVGPECPSYILQEGLELGKRILLGYQLATYYQPTATRIEVEGVFLGFRLEPKLMSGKDICVTIYLYHPCVGSWEAVMYQESSDRFVATTRTANLSKLGRQLGWVIENRKLMIGRCREAEVTKIEKGERISMKLQCQEPLKLSLSIALLSACCQGSVCTT